MPYNMMILPLEIKRDSESIAFNRHAAVLLGDRLSTLEGPNGEEGLYRVDEITAAFPWAQVQPYPFNPGDYPVSGVAVGLCPLNKDYIRKLAAKGQYTLSREPKLFHLIGDNIDLIIVEQKIIVDKDERTYVKGTYLQGRIGLKLQVNS